MKFEVFFLKDEIDILRNAYHVKIINDEYTLDSVKKQITMHEIAHQLKKDGYNGTISCKSAILYYDPFESKRKRLINEKFHILGLIKEGKMTKYYQQKLKKVEQQMDQLFCQIPEQMIQGQTMFFAEMKHHSQLFEENIIYAIEFGLNEMDVKTKLFQRFLSTRNEKLLSIQIIPVKILPIMNENLSHFVH